MTGWVLVGVALWCAAAVVVALAVGRMIRLRDREVPTPGRRVPHIPTQRRAADAGPARDPGRGDPGRGDPGCGGREAGGPEVGGPTGRDRETRNPEVRGR